MKLILIDGGPAAGKNSLGAILADHFKATGQKAVLLDNDYFVEEICPTWIWKNNEQKEKDLLMARNNFIKAIDNHLKENYIVMAIGVRVFSKEDIALYTKKLTSKCQIYLYHLSVPLELRRQRLHQRGSHSLIDLDQDQKDRDAVKVWPGYIYENLNTPEEDALNLIKLIESDKGRLAY